MATDKITVKIHIKNDTDLGLAIFGTPKLKAKEVPKEIEPHSTITISCHLPAYLGFGHRGHLIYNAEDEIQRTCQFEFKWDYNALLHRAVAKFPEYYSVFVTTQRAHHYLDIFFAIERCQYLEYPLSKRFSYLEEYTYFSSTELPIVYQMFLQISGGKPRIDKEAFFKFYSMFDREDALIQSLFNVFSSLGVADEIIDFEEFCIALSIVCRGSFYEKTRLAYAICDLDKNGFVSEEEALKVADEMSKLMVTRGFDPETFGSPKNVIENIYRTVGEKKVVEMPGVGYEEFFEKAQLSEGLNKEQFINKALEEPDMSECFGLFKFWRERVLNNYLRPELAGTKYKEYSGFVHIGRKRRWVVLRDGFLAYYKTEQGEKPYKVYDMTLATLKEAKDGVLVRTFHSVIVMKIKEKIEEWISVLRTHIREGYRYQSFRETRLDTYAKYLVNGEEYFAALLKVIKGAKESIYIAGWYLAPWIYLKRNPIDPETELGKVLYEKACEGVKIRIIIWDCQKFVYDLQSSTVCKLLEHTHPNIECISHPHNLNLLWSHHQKSVVIDENIAFLGGIDLAYNRYDDSEYSLTDPDSQKFPGRDYSNFALHPEESGKPIPDVIDRSKSPRMPWHDISLQITGKAAQDVAINFIQKWNHCLLTSSALKKTFLMPSRKVKHVKLPAEDLGFPDCKVQILRSAGSWSLGIPVTEKSISKAYESLITHSDHFIYIENQYFISGLNGDAKPQNRILRALYDRLRRAISHKEQFRVIIVLPVHPAGDPKALSTRFIMKFAAETINLGPGSIFQQLAMEFPDVELSQYITFHALRNRAILEGNAVTEQIYIHAKLLIVDDRVVIIGSANINDRSMCGDRDSEICALVEPNEYVQSEMAGKPYPVSAFAHELRMKLWRNFLGLPQGDQSIKDPVCDEVYQGIWRATAKNNTEIYKTVFPVIADNIENVEDYKNDPTPQNVELLDKIKGVVVDYPYRFLINSLIGVVPMAKIFI